MEENRQEAHEAEMVDKEDENEEKTLIGTVKKKNLKKESFWKVYSRKSSNTE